MSAGLQRRHCVYVLVNDDTMKGRLSHILDDHCQRYARLQVVDLYKLLHQASMGSEHAVTGMQGVRSWLEVELVTMGIGPQEQLIDEIHPGGDIVRVHLRPYVMAGHDPAALLEVFVHTAREYQGSVEMLEDSLSVAARLASAGRLPLEPEQLKLFMAQMAGQGYPAAHHSPVYRRLYRPAYRVVARAYLEPAIASKWHGTES